MMLGCGFAGGHQKTNNNGFFIRIEHSCSIWHQGGRREQEKVAMAGEQLLDLLFGWWVLRIVPGMTAVC